jgi:hypothetical protein
VSITHAAWVIDAVRGMHARYSVKNLGTACAACARTAIFRPSWPFPGALVIVRRNAGSIGEARARLVADCRAAGIQRTVKLTNALIAATTIEHRLPVVTQDDRQIARAQSALRLCKCECTRRPRRVVPAREKPKCDHLQCHFDQDRKLVNVA